MKKLNPFAFFYFFFQFLSSSIAISLAVMVIIDLWIVLRPNFSNLSALGTELNSFNYFPLINWIIFLFIIYLLLLVFWTILYYNNYTYELTPDSIKQQFGVISKKFIAIPYDNIQDVDIYQGILMRILHIAKINIETASKDPDEKTTGTTIFAISISEAQNLKDDIMKAVDAHR